MNIPDYFFPEGLLDYFEITKFDKSYKRYEISLDERFLVPDSENSYSSQGFTEPCTIQDFPIRGHAVYLHIRRRKWLEKETGRVITTLINLSHDGTGLTEEFALFLKKIGLSPEQYL